MHQADTKSVTLPLDVCVTLRFATAPSRGALIPMIDCEPTPAEIKHAGMMATEILEGRTLLGPIRIAPSIAKVRASVDHLLDLARRIDVRHYDAQNFKDVIGSLDEASALCRSFYYLNRRMADLEFLDAAANEFAAARRLVVQGLSPNPALNPSRDEIARLTTEAESNLHHALING